MRICQLLLSQGNGGLEKHVRELSAQLQAEGHDVAVIADKTFLATLPAGIARFAVPAGFGRLNPLLNLLVLGRVRQFQPDIIHAQANKAASVLSHLRFAVSAVTVGTLHNIKRHTRAFEKLDHVITVSRQLAQPFPEQHRSVIYNGIDQTTAVEAPDLHAVFNLQPNLPVLLAVGRLVKAKGFDMLLDAIDGLAINLLLVGDGPERQSLQQRIKRLKAVTCVKLLGQRHDVPALMAAADGTLISSRREGFSYVFSEAVLNGCPVLSTDVPVANEVLPADLLVPVDDPVYFRAKLMGLLANPDQWSVLMHGPCQLASQTMTLKAMSHHTLDTYSRLMQQRPC